jgi:branched-subunit amino acid aminotransferase/4-amino-4-deoxychorismate lyase
VHAGRVWLLERHVARLERDARALGLGELDPQACRSALERAAREAFGSGSGVVRLELRAGRRGPRLAATPRPLGPEPGLWRAVSAPEPHPGPGPAPGAKRAGLPAIESAREAARAADADEALLFDTAGWLVEGARSSVVVVRADGRAFTPPLARGGVAGIARALALAACPSLGEADVARDALAGAREIVALNAVRGARAIAWLDGVEVGDGRPGPWTRRLAEALAGADRPL